jgi:hypothetical protein
VRDGAGIRISLEALKHRVESIERGLSERELKVCARALYGQSIEGTHWSWGSAGRASQPTGGALM